LRRGQSNTVETPIAQLYEKLEVGRRIPAVEKAGWLALIPPVDRS
jgi:ATP/maltotriose-dependent transcriptional regulator MalT